ncbi:MAG: sigma-54-dependent Fis family transcriptional regulator [Candidatus Hydrogenedentes bacterium]|nr:sigma-54-dependent Fis family transcriptional regulator [Candidatus Hydrogenedentota bacterium]
MKTPAKNTEPSPETANGYRILVVDDDESQRSLLVSFLSSQGFSVTAASSGEEALTVLGGALFNLLISDVRMPGLSGLDTLRRLRQENNPIPVLLVTAYADVRDAVGAMRDGAANYLEKPIDLDELLESVSHSLGASDVMKISSLAELPIPDSVVAQSPQMRRVLQEAALVAPSDSRVLITGESGAGKEVVADLIHAWSRRSAAPMIKVNCAAIPETLLESELFGHEKGSFTGAVAQRVGRFEEAAGGTILLDEVAEMSSGLQAKLLRVAQDGTFQRVGSNLERASDVRVLAATNRDLEKEVSSGRFREDLYYRLNVVEIHVPPLRERPADILEMAHRFAEFFLKRKVRLSPSVISCLELYEWPGNARELRNAMERATLMARGDLMLPEHFPKRVSEAGRSAEREVGEGAGGSRIDDVERVLILKTLRENAYNRTETAKTLGISRRALIYKLRRYREQGHATENG